MTASIKDLAARAAEAILARIEATNPRSVSKDMLVEEIERALEAAEPGAFARRFERAIAAKGLPSTVPGFDLAGRTCTVVME